jgi:hypothetical protein
MRVNSHKKAILMSSAPNPVPQRQLKLEADASLKATYSNTVVISHTQHEVVFDFVQIVPSDNRARVLDRVVMTPTHAKLFLGALAENILRYESRFGAIATPPRPPTLADQLFSSVSNPPAPDDSAGGEA